MPYSITKASLHHIPAIVKLVNSAYRGESARAGWTHEADLIDGERRTDVTEIGSLMSAPDTAFVLYKNDEAILGSVYLEKQNQDLYLGMLSVNPKHQALGIGKLLIKAGEEFAVNQNCQAIIMTVISVRKELIEWYERLGYRDTGERKPFPDTGPLERPRMPLEFIVMKKQLATSF